MWFSKSFMSQKTDGTEPFLRDKESAQENHNFQKNVLLSLF
jgi:hypothetical protein